MCLADCVLLLYVPVLCTQIPVLWVVADGVAADAVAISTCAVHADATSACVVDMCCRCLAVAGAVYANAAWGFCRLMLP